MRPVITCSLARLGANQTYPFDIANRLVYYSMWFATLFTFQILLDAIQSFYTRDTTSVGSEPYWIASERDPLGPAKIKDLLE